MRLNKKPFSASESHSYNVNVATSLKHVGKAVILKEMHRSHNFWALQHKGDHDGLSWFFLRMDKLKDLYPEYNSGSMYRWISQLEEDFLIASRNDLNQHRYDKTRWFTVNLEAYEKLVHLDTSPLSHSQNENSGRFSSWAISVLKIRNAILKITNSNSQNGNSNSQNATTIQTSIKDLDNNLDKRPLAELKNSPSLFEIPKIDSDKNKMIKDSILLIEVLNEFAGRNLPRDPKGRGKKNIDYVMYLLKKQYTFEEVELMIQYKCFEWVGNLKMQKHLTPITLFKRWGEDYIQEAKEAQDNPVFLKMIQDSKKAEDKSNGVKSSSGAVTEKVIDNLVNW